MVISQVFSPHKIIFIFIGAILSLWRMHALWRCLLPSIPKRCRHFMNSSIQNFGKLCFLKTLFCIFIGLLFIELYLDILLLAYTEEHYRKKQQKQKTISQNLLPYYSMIVEDMFCCAKQCPLFREP